MSETKWIPVLFWVAAAYDGVLGLAFLAAPARLFELLDVTPPNHFGYVHFPAALLVVFALMFVAMALDPERNRNLVPFGVLLKVSYCGVVFLHWFTEDIPNLWKPFAVMDVVFLVLFLVAYQRIGRNGVVRA